MSITIQQIKPAEIEAESFRIIDREQGAHPFDAPTWSVVRRVIHATGDFSFADNLRFGPGALTAGLAAIRAGKNILTDVNMTATGISKHLLASHGGKVFCGVADPEVAEQARRRGLTRSEVAIDNLLPENIGIVAIGNAPTALLRVMERRQTLAPEQRPDLIIGVPVGFVNAAESKELLSQQNYPHITALGRKGGSPTAATIVNALLRLATAEAN